MRWIIILLIILVLAAIRGVVGRQRRQKRWNRSSRGQGQKEVVVSRPPRLLRDMEVAEDLEPEIPGSRSEEVQDVELERTGIGVGSGAEDFVDLENTPHGLYGTALIPHHPDDEEYAGETPDLEDLRKVITQEHRNDTRLHQRAAKYHRSALITPLNPGKAPAHRTLPTWEIYGFTDEELEVAENLPDSQLETQPHRLRVLEPGLTADHQLRIGYTPPPLPAHDMPIHLEVSPTLTALVKDPYWAFVYWVLPVEVPAGQWELRVQNLSEQSEFFERVDPAARRWYLHLNQPNHSFTFTLGVRDGAGHFHPVLSSGPLQMPPDRPSDLIDADWLSIEELYQGLGKLRPQGSPAFALEMGGASEMLQNKH